MAQKFRNIQEIENTLKAFVPNVSRLLGDGMSLDRMWPLMEALGNPQDRLKVIHVAGTSGKTSTCYYISKILQTSGKKVGLTVSPHVSAVTERLQVNGEELEELKFCKYFEDFLCLTENVNNQVSYFELLIALVIWVAEKEKVDYLVLETGMGGLLDATNIVRSSNKICIITDIGLDHTNILGNSLSEISAQKAGIIQENNSVFLFEQALEVMDPIIIRAEQKNANLTTLEYEELVRKTDLELDKVVEFQKRNWVLAECVCKFVAKKDDFQLLLPDPKAVVVPGRFEIIDQKDCKLIFDGAHNQQKMHAFVSSFVKKFPDQKADILLALKEGKEYKDVLDELQSICNKLIITTFNTSQDLPAKSINPNIVADYATQIGILNEVLDDNDFGYSELLKTKSKLKIITGSFYLISQIRKY